MPEDINNNAKLLECADQAIVGSSKSLIQAIKKRRVSEVSCQERISEEDDDTVNVNLTSEEEGEYCDNPFDDDWADDEEISEDSEAETIEDEEVHLNLSMQDGTNNTGRMNNSSTRPEEEELSESDPRVQKLLWKMLKKHLDEENKPKNANESPIREGAKGRATAIKSPSDTTLYTPALKNGMSPTGKRMAMIANNDSGGNSEIVDRISEFVEQMHFESNSIADKQWHGSQEELPQWVDLDVGDDDPNEVARQSQSFH